MYVYVYIYIFEYVYVYIIYMYMNMYMYIYIYISIYPKLFHWKNVDQPWLSVKPPIFAAPLCGGRPEW